MTYNEERYLNRRINALYEMIKLKNHEIHRLEKQRDSARAWILGLGVWMIIFSLVNILYILY